MPLSLTDLPAGHSFPPTTIIVSREDALAYRAAVGDGLAVYDEFNAVPPLALVALALGELLKQVALPPGSMHGSERASFTALVPVGAAVECQARLAQRSVRAGWVVSVLESDLAVDGKAVGSARATVLSPAPRPEGDRGP